MRYHTFYDLPLLLPLLLPLPPPPPPPLNPLTLPHYPNLPPLTLNSRGRTGVCSLPLPPLTPKQPAGLYTGKMGQRARADQRYEGQGAGGG